MKAYSAAYCSLRIFGNDLDPLSVTKKLKIPPDFQSRRGEPRLGRSKKGKILEYSPYSTNMWSFSSKGWVKSPNLSIHFKWLLKELESKKQFLLEYKYNPSITVDVFCYSTGYSKKPPAIPKKIKEQFNELGIEIVIDHYPNSEESTK